jgi:hypothetical protein
MKNHTHVKYTSIFTWKPNAGENQIYIFYYMYLIITFIGSTDFLFSLFASGRRLQPPIFSGYNLREDPTPQLSSYNRKEDTTPYVVQLQMEGGYNHLSLPRPATLKYK